MLHPLELDLRRGQLVLRRPSITGSGMPVSGPMSSGYLDAC